MRQRVITRLSSAARERLASLVRRELTQKLDVGETASAMRRLRRAAALFDSPLNHPLQRLAGLIDNLPTLIKRSARPSGDLRHLFAGAAPDPGRVEHLKLAAELERLAKSPVFDTLLRDPQQFRGVERAAAALSTSFSGSVERYADQAVVTGAYNQIVQRLYPNDYVFLRVDAHHVIEERTYDKFRAGWQMLGWESAEDMPALPLMYEYHIRTPKHLPGIEDLAKKNDWTSLSADLRTHINLDAIDSPEALLRAYAAYYFRQKIWKDVEPVLRAVERQISVAKSAARLVQQAKPLP
jgi:hypothetical protein